MSDFLAAAGVLVTAAACAASILIPAGRLRSLAMVVAIGLFPILILGDQWHTQQIVDFANAAKKPVVAIVNSHWHLDHVGGNVLLREKYPGVRVYASGAIEDAMHGFLANYHAQVEDVIENHLLPALGEGSNKIVMVMSTVDPDQVAALAARVVPRGIRYLDVPVSGTSDQVRRGEQILLA